MYHDGILPGISLSQGKKRTTVRFRLSTIETWERKREKIAVVAEVVSGNGK
jgi:hypothetical protein